MITLVRFNNNKLSGLAMYNFVGAFQLLGVSSLPPYTLVGETEVKKFINLSWSEKTP